MKEIHNLCVSFSPFHWRSRGKIHFRHCNWFLNTKKERTKETKMDSIPTAVTWPRGKVLVAWSRDCRFGSHFSRSPSFSLQRLFSECWILCLVFRRRCNLYTVSPFITLNSILKFSYSIFLWLLSTVQTPLIYVFKSQCESKEEKKRYTDNMG